MLLIYKGTLTLLGGISDWITQLDRECQVDLGFGRTKVIKLHLKLFTDVHAWMFSVKQFHVFMAFGKKSFV